MAGRPKKPENVKVLQGTFRKDRANAKAPRPRPGIPEAPDWMPPEAQREWGRVVAELENLGIVCKLDRSDLAAYCVLWAQFVESAKKGELLPAAFIAQMRCYSNSFGLNPAAREKLTMPEKFEPKKSKYAL